MQSATVISPQFYADVVAHLTGIKERNDAWSVRGLILQQALNQLDAGRHVTMVMLSLCTAPECGKPVRSLHGAMCVGYPPAGSSLDLKPFLGAESIVGRVAATGQPILIHDMQENITFPLPRNGGHQSMVSYPLQRGSRIAGVFNVASSQPFAHAAFQELIKQYAQLMSLTCDQEELYKPEELALVIMPSLSVQRPYLARFAERLWTQLSQRANQQSVSHTQAECIVRQQLEEELFTVAVSV